MSKKYNYGGQAVIEGVMMRGQKAAVTAVRRPNGSVAMDIQMISAIYNGWLRRTLFVRGIIVLIESMVLGIKSLIYSANTALEEEEDQLSSKSVWLMMAVALALAVGLFFLAPLFITRAINPMIPNSVVFHVIEGVVRLVFFIGYLWAISRMSDIQRVFTYHGAEHKTVNAHEANVPLEVSEIRAYSTAHTRCGTSFLFVVLILAIVIFAAIGRQELWIMIVTRIVLIPVIAGISYEITYWGSRYSHLKIVRAILTPGLWLQRLTTGEPEDDQLEIAIAALKKAIEIDQAETEQLAPSA
ncbi:MAG: DUF1385 domain-containing protein [Deltaproteobacteria bacterium]|nr:DUF1385 domain-containing protein [Deltaproteobacteria bacterium]